MSRLNSNIAKDSWIATSGTESHHIALRIVTSDDVPESVRRGDCTLRLKEVVMLTMAASESIQSKESTASNDVVVVAEVLGEGLLEEGTPERVVMSLIGELGAPLFGL